MRLRIGVLGLMLAFPAGAHDLSLDVSGTFTRASANNPRAGGASLGISGSFDLNDQWSLMGTAVYTRDFGTKTQDTSSPGSNVGMASLGAMWLPTDHLMTAVNFVLSPPVSQQNASTLTTNGGRPIDVIIDSRSWSFGASWNGLWNSGPSSTLEHTVDLGAGINRFSVDQKLELADTAFGRALIQSCAMGVTFAVCPLVEGAHTLLFQGRFNAGYTATLFTKTDVGLDGAYYVYDRPPSTVGYFSVVAFGRAELGRGVPVLPLLFTVRPHVAQRIGPVTLKLSYQYGGYTENLGALHTLTLRASWKVTKSWRLSAMWTMQLDASGGQVSNLGGQGLLGVLYIW